MIQANMQPIGSSPAQGIGAGNQVEPGMLDHELVERIGVLHKRVVRMIRIEERQLAALRICMRHLRLSVKQENAIIDLLDGDALPDVDIRGFNQAMSRILRTATGRGCRP